MTYITDEMRSIVGRRISSQTSFPISESDIRRWALAVYWPEEPPRLFWDAEYAAGTVHGGIVAPEEFNPFAWMVAAEERMATFDAAGDVNRVERAFGITGPGLEHELNGGLEVSYGVRMRPGDVITSVSRHGGYTEREGRHGLMLMTTTETTATNDRGETVRVSRMTQIRYGR